MPEQLNVIALISGGKDSLYTILHCIKNGHRVVALANLCPPPRLGQEKVKGSLGSEEEDKDLDSYMYQTIGYSVIPLYEEALEIPLFRQEIRGRAVNTSRDYHHQASTGRTEQEQDETESIYQLLQRVLQAYPEANAVCAGAVLSTYQRTRIENVALRLNLTPLAWLWMYPYLPAPSHCQNAATTAARVPITGLLDDMAACGCEARIIKVASGGLDESDLWGDLVSQDGTVRRTIVKRLGRFLDEGIEAAVLGEGGEYESLALDGPRFLWKKRIHVGSMDGRVGDAGVAFLSLKGARCVEKEAFGNVTECTLDDVRVPRMFDDEFRKLLDTVKLNEVKRAVPIYRKKEDKRCGRCMLQYKESRGQLNVYNLAAPEAGSGASKQMHAIKDKLAVLLGVQKKKEGEGLTPDDAIFSTILLRSMDDFSAVNAIYSSLFTQPNPPARATVACGDSMPTGVDIMISFTFYLGRSTVLQALHVQSRSYWAPANIGPYSQAVYAPIESSSGQILAAGPVYIAGQIPLDPSSMQIYSPTGESGGKPSLFLSQAALSLQHLWRIGRAMEVRWWMGAVVFLSAHAGVRSRAAVAWDMWKWMNEDHHTEDTEEGDGDSSTFDVWHVKYGGQYSQPKKEVTMLPIPDFDIVQGTSVIPSFFAIEVDELPRGSSIEWQGLGLKGSDVTLSYDQVDDLRVLHASGSEFGCYTSISIVAKHDVDLEVSLRKAVQIATENLPQGGVFSHMALYTPHGAEFDAWDGQVIPCKAVYGCAAEELVAALIFQTSPP
ncbi:ATP binding L-PSP endoribonuclease family protein, putative [Trichophyton verrucosum HKI 0517]|uniref:Diphthine--ammonia ligase n=1 Tax=Trichophyton verrucosum (strain HKI 0517) TaxID=663202 RepID=D4DAQ7_TRIVH|nr:ATP binding L-PSP endoribonuclease family protein, putative [Trichophyton verrucosum HKI 0517]EFE41076.1 ATP binding L-PSP endoribonuclease family protein, putative [Trichophyton verrucosum HKI 0517]